MANLNKTAFSNKISRLTAKALVLSILSVFVLALGSTPVSAQSLTGSSANSATGSESNSYVTSSTASDTAAVDSITTRANPVATYTLGNYTYVINDTSHTLQIIDTSNPASPKLDSTISTYLNPESVTALGDRVYVGLAGTSDRKATDAVIQVFNVSNPAKPVDLNGNGTKVGGDPPAAIYPVAFDGNIYLVAATYDSQYNYAGYAEYEVTNPSKAVAITGDSLDGGGPVHLYVYGNYVFEVTDSSLDIFNISNIDVPVFVNPSSGGVGTLIATDLTAVTANNKYAYITSGLQRLYIVNYASNLAKPTIVNGTNGTSTNTDAHDSLPFAIGLNSDNKYAYVVCYGINRIETFKISNPAKPKMVSKADTQNAPDTLSFSKNLSYLFVTNYRTDSFQSFSLSNPAKP